MVYSEKLILAVKSVYGDNEKIIQLLNSGNTFLGRYLDDNSNGDISYDEVILSNSLESLHEKARLIKRKREIYGMWCDEDPRRKI